MRWAPAALTAALAELLAHFLSLAWGFSVLVLAFVFVAVRMSALAIPMAAKTRATEDRVNAIIPVLAVHAAGIATAQAAANGAQTTANTANGTANNAQGAANTAQGTANNALGVANGAIQSGSNATLAGLHVTGSETVDGGFTVNGTSNFNAQMDANSVNLSALTNTGNTTLDGNLTVSGNGIRPGQNPPASPAATLASLKTCCDALIGTLVNSGIA